MKTYILGIKPLDKRSRDIIKLTSPFKSLDSKDSKRVLDAFTPMTFAPGEVITRQGKAGIGMFILTNGLVDINTRLPGDKLCSLGNATPGAMIDEINLLERGQSTTTTTAISPCTTFFLSHGHFDMLRFGDPNLGFKLNQSIALDVCDRLRVLYKNIVSEMCKQKTEGIKQKDNITTSKTELKYVSLGKHSPLCDLTYLQRLDFFEPFAKEEINLFIRPVRLLEAPRNAIIYEENATSQNCYIPIQGAVQIFMKRNYKQSNLSVHGPGNLFGQLAFIEKGKHASTSIAREPAFLLEISRHCMRKYYEIDKPFWYRCFDRMCQSLIRELRFANKQLIRLRST